MYDSSLVLVLFSCSEIVVTWLDSAHMRRSDAAASIFFHEGTWLSLQAVYSLHVGTT